MHSPYLTDKAIEEMHERSKLEIEAFELLALIVAEFESDPMSVQCFDLRIVERAKRVVAKLKTTDPVWLR